MKNVFILRKRWRIKLSCLLYLTLFCSMNGYSADTPVLTDTHSLQQQEKKQLVKGTVIDFETGEPIISASIALSGERVGTITDIDGNFSLQIDGETAQLDITYIGFTKQTVTATVSKPIIVRLRTNTELIDEVVVIGYGTTKRSDLTGSIGKPNLQDMRKAPVSNFEESLAGRVAGVQVTSSDGQPGSDLNIVIRGNNSVTQDNSPLYVVDGFPLETAVGNVLNTEEIESMEILKDASATAIYGARGANGVILITTKKGKVGAPVVTYNGWVGIHQIIKYQDVMDPYEFVRYQLDQNEALYSRFYLKDGKTLEDYRDMEGINWQDLVFRDAWVHNHNVAVRGGSDKTRYSLSGSAMNQNGIIINSGYEKYQGRAVLDQIINDRLKVGINLNYTSTKKYGTVVAGQEASPTANFMYSVWGYRSITGDTTKDENLVSELYDEDVDVLVDHRVNPVKTAQNTHNPVFTNNFMANGYLEYKILKDLSLRVTGGYHKIYQKWEVFNNSESKGGHKYTNSKVNGSITNVERTNFLNENTLTYNKRFKGGHTLKAVAGFTVQDANAVTYGFTAIQIPNESLGMAGLNEGQVTTTRSADSSNGLLSYLGRVDYNFKSRYLMTFSFRADGSSKFPKDNQWAYFPSGSVAWAFGEEKFMKNLSFLNSGKVRAGLGTTGNNRVNDYAASTALQITTSSGYGTGNNANQGIIPTSVGNSQLKWETTVQTNIGLDLSFFKDRITFTTDYYRKKTNDLLLNATLAPSMGFLSAYKNVGKVSNSGIEFTLDTKNIETKNFSWSSNFNISFNRNKVLALNEDEPSLATRVTWGNFNNAYPYIAIPGQPIAMFYGHLFDGIYQYEDFDQYGETYVLKAGIPNNGNPRERIQPGDIKFKDINGDGVVDDYDLTIIGNPNPKHIGGFNNNFRYKDFDLNVFFQWSYGGDIMNANRIEFEGGDPNTRNFLNMFASFADRWTPENPSNTMYRVGGQGPAVYSSRTVEDGSFLRLKTISFGYRLPPSVLKKINIKSLRVYTSAQNLVTWTKYSGLDPEVSTRPTALTPSFDWSPYPRPRVITFGVDITF